MGRVAFDKKTGDPILMESRVFNLRIHSSLGGLERYFKGLEDGKLYGVICKKCGLKHYPPVPQCKSCRSRELEWIEVPSRGRLITYAEINVKPQTHSNYPDYVVGVADFQGVKVVGIVKGDYEEISPDMTVRWEIGVRDGEEYPTLYLVPLGKD